MLRSIDRKPPRSAQLARAASDAITVGWRDGYLQEAGIIRRLIKGYVRAGMHNISRGAAHERGRLHVGSSCHLCLDARIDQYLVCVILNGWDARFGRSPP